MITERDVILAILILSFFLVLRAIVSESTKLILLKRSNELIQEGNAIIALQEHMDFNFTSRITVQGKWVLIEYYNYFSALRYVVKAADILLEPMTNALLDKDYRFRQIRLSLRQLRYAAIDILENYSDEEDEA